MNRKNPLFSADMDRESHVFKQPGPMQGPGLDFGGASSQGGGSAIPEEAHTSSNPGPDRPHPFTENTGKPGRPDDVSNKAKEEAVHSKGKGKKKVGDVVVKKAPKASGEIEMSIYSKIVASLKRLATTPEEEAAAAEESAADAASQTTEPAQGPEEIVIEEGRATEQAREDLERQKQEAIKRGRDAMEIARKLVEEFKAKQRALPAGTEMVEVDESTPEGKEWLAAKDAELKALTDYLESIGKKVLSIGVRVMKQAEVAEKVGNISKTRAAYGKYRSWFDRANRISERMKAVLMSKDAIEKGIKSIQFGPTHRAVFQATKSKTAPGQVYFERVDELIKLMDRLAKILEMMEEPGVDEAELSALEMAYSQVKEKMDELEFARGRKGVPEEAFEFFRENRGKFDKAVEFLKNLSSSVSDYYNKLLGKGGRLSTMPLVHQNIPQVNAMIDNIEENIRDLKLNIRSMVGEGSVLEESEIQKVVKDMQDVEKRFADLKLLSSPLPGRSESGLDYRFLARKALRESASVAEVVSGIEKVSQDIEMAESLLISEESMEKFLSEMEAEASGLEEFFKGVQMQLEEYESWLESGGEDEGFLSSLIDSAKEFFNYISSGSFGGAELAPAAASLKSESDVRKAIMAGLSRRAEPESKPGKGFLDWIRELREKGGDPTAKPSDFRVLEEGQTPPTPEAVEQAEGYVGKLEKEISKGVEKEVSKLSTVKAEIDAIKKNLESYAGVTPDMKEKYAEMTVVLKLLKEKEAEATELARQEVELSSAEEREAEADKSVLIAAQNMLAASERMRAASEAVASSKGIDNAPALFMLFKDIHGEFVNLKDVDIKVIVDRNAANFSRKRMWGAMFKNVEKFVKGKIDLPGGFAAKAAMDLIRTGDAKESLGLLQEFFRELTRKVTTVNEISIRSLPKRKKKTETGNVVETTSTDPKYEGIAEGLAEKGFEFTPPDEEPAAEGEQSAPGGATSASFDNGLSKKADGEAAAYEDLASYMNEISDFLEGLHAALEYASNFYIENNQGLSFLYEAAADARSESGAQEAAPADMGMELAPSPAAKEDEMKRTAGDYDEFDKGNRLEIVESDGKRKLHLRVINDDLKEKVQARVNNAIHGSFKCGDQVQVDLIDYLGFGTVKAYLGNGTYRVEVDGAVMEVPSNRVLGLDKNPWR